MPVRQYLARSQCAIIRSTKAKYSKEVRYTMYTTLKIAGVILWFENKKRYELEQNRRDNSEHNKST